MSASSNYDQYAKGMECKPEGPGQAGKMGLCEPYEVQQTQMQDLAPGSE